MVSDEAWVPTSEHATTSGPSSFSGPEEAPSAQLAAMAAAAPGSSPSPPCGLVGGGTYILAGAAAAAAALAALALTGRDPPDGPAKGSDCQVFRQRDMANNAVQPDGTAM